MAYYKIQTRKRIPVNPDPQRRCYNGAHASSELQWTGWVNLETVMETQLDRRLEYWRELNDYAVEVRGESAKAEFRSVPMTGEEVFKYFND